MELKIPNVMIPFLEKRRYKVAAGGRGCVHGDTLLDTPDGQVMIRDFEGGAIYCATDEGVVVGYASKPVKYQPADLFTVTLSDGSEITCTGKHRFLTERGWLDTSSLAVGSKLLRPHESAVYLAERCCEASLSESLADVHHCWKTLLGFLYCYSEGYRPCGERLHQQSETYRDVLQRLADAQPHTNHTLSREDDRATAGIDSHSNLSRRLSSLIALLFEEAQNLRDSENYTFGKSSEQLSALCQSFLQFHENNSLALQVQHIAKHVLLFCNSKDQAGSQKTVADMLQLCVDDKTYSDSISCKSDHYSMAVAVTKVEFHSHDVYYDVFVPLYNNYMTNGIISHNSSKSWSVAQMLLIAAATSKLRILCARELQNSIADSVHRLLSDQIDRLGLQQYFAITRDAIRCPSTGSEFMFKGLRHSISEIKSLEGIDICWVEEAGLVSEESWEILIPTIRKEGSEIWITFNPDNEGDPTYQRFVKNPPPNALVVEVNWRDNEFFPDTLRQEMEYCKEVDYESYLTIWEGKPRRISESVIFKDKFEVCDFDVPEETRFYYGADFGFAKDPSVLVRTWVRDFNLYIDYEAYGVGVDIEDLPKMYDTIPGARRWPIKADGSRPETISAMQRAGFNMSAAKKWSGSVLDGIEYMRGFKRILIHTRCPKAAEEFRNYSYKVDRITKDILPVPASGWDHCFVAGTLVTTSIGDMPIEDVNVGDEVLTRNGYRRVLATGISGIDKETVTVNTLYSSITCTPNHKVFTLNRGFVPVDALRYNDDLLSIVSEDLWKAYGLMESISDGIQKARGGVTAVTSSQAITNIMRSIFIGIFGSRRMEQYQQECTSIMLMETPQIMTCPTLNASQSRNMQASMSGAKKGRSDRETTLRESGHSQRLGTQARKACKSIERLAECLTKRLFQPRKNASNARSNLTPNKLDTETFSVQMPVSQHGDETPELMTLQDHALIVERILSATSTAKKRLVQDRVQTITSAGTERLVYDLTVEQDHEFFANGILVHNCIDSVRYSLDGLITGRNLMHRMKLGGL